MAELISVLTISWVARLNGLASSVLL
jgi:hypothetical protein